MSETSLCPAHRGGGAAGPRAAARVSNSTPGADAASAPWGSGRRLSIRRRSLHLKLGRFDLCRERSRFQHGHRLEPTVDARRHPPRERADKASPELEGESRRPSSLARPRSSGAAPASVARSGSPPRSLRWTPPQTGATTVAHVPGPAACPGSPRAADRGGVGPDRTESATPFSPRPCATQTASSRSRVSSRQPARRYSPTGTCTAPPLDPHGERPLR